MLLLVIETPDESRVIELFRQSLMHAWRALGMGDLPEMARLHFELLNKSSRLHDEDDTARFADVGGANRLQRRVEQRRPLFLQDPPPIEVSGVPAGQ